MAEQQVLKDKAYIMHLFTMINIDIFILIRRMMGAGPWKTASCMSAYCVNAQKMADFVGMKCWENDGKTRYFSLILF